MLSRLLGLLDVPDASTDGVEEKTGVELASAALLMEIVHADYKRDSSEIEAATQALRRTFSLPDELLDTVLAKAEQLHSEAVSIHPFIELINEDFDEGQKYHLIVNLWRVAMADGELDKFEQHYIRKIAELLYVPHSDFIRAKLQVLDKESIKPSDNAS